ncbi:MAG: DUF805 domain-containing protein [Pseudomonadota bacterium]
MWYYADGEQQFGPISDEELSKLMQDSVVRPETLVWREGQSSWQPAIEVVPQHMRPDAAGAPPPLPNETSTPASTTQPQQQDYTFDSGQDGWPAHHPYGFQDSVRHVFNNYFNVKGRARRREYWWWVLFVILTSLAASIIDVILFGTNVDGNGPLGTILLLAILAPSICVTARRLHDIGRTGWWQLIGLIPLIGFLVMIYFTVQKSDPGPNEYGPE